MILIKLIRFTLGLAILLSMTHCRKANPHPPKAEGFDPAIPPAISYLSGPLTFRLKGLQEKINQELDPVLVGKGSPGGQQGGLTPYRIARSGPVRVQYTGNQVRLSAPLALFVAPPFSSGKQADQKPFCSLHVNFQSPLTVTENWRLASNVQFVDFQWIQEPEIRLLGKDIPLTNFVQKILDKHQSSIETAIDSAVYKELRLDELVKPIWENIQEPLLIDKQYGLWLLPKPVGVEAGPITGDREKITVPLRIAFASSTKLQAQKPTPSKVKLPVLQKKEHIPQLSDLRLLSSIPYADINRMLARTLSQEKHKLLLGSLTINKASVYGSQRSLIVKTEVAGLLNGTLYLRGRPTFDTLTNTLSVKNLDFDPGTVRELPKITSSLVHKGLIKMFEKLLSISLGREIKDLPKNISQSYEENESGKKTDLSIKEFRFTPQKIAIRPDGIQTLIKIESKVGVQVNQL